MPFCMLKALNKTFDILNILYFAVIHSKSYVSVENDFETEENAKKIAI